MALLTNLVSYWKLDEASGTRADAHGSNTLADNNTVGSAAGIINNGADFEAGNSESLSITDASQSGLDLTGDLTFSLWFKPESQPGTDTAYALIAKLVSAGNQQSYAIQYRDDAGVKKLGCLMYFDGGSLDFDAVNQTLNNGTIYHIVLTKSGTTGQFYVNGSTVGASFTTSAAFNSTAPFEIGSLQAGTSQFADGIIDEVGVWSRAITSGEVTSLYNAGAGLAYPLVTVQNLTLTAALGAFTLSGIAATFKLGRGIIAGVGQFILTGMDATLSDTIPNVWTNQTKHASTFTNQSKNTSNWTNRLKA